MTQSTFDFRGSNGHKLSGRLESPKGTAHHWAIFAHCFSCGKDSLAAARISKALALRGIGVLRFDFTGLGKSEGEFGQSGFTCNIYDLMSATQAMENAGMTPSLLVGHSLGGTAVLASSPYLSSVKAVVTIGSPADAGLILNQFNPHDLENILKLGQAQVTLSGRQFEFYKSFIEDVQKHDLMAQIDKIHKALLILHAPEDLTVNINNAERIFKAAHHPKSFISLSGADHLLTNRADADYVASVIASWAERYTIADESK